MATKQCPTGEGGNWGTLRIPGEDWGNLRKHEGKPFQKWCENLDFGDQLIEMAGKWARIENGDFPIAMLVSF